MGGYPSVLVGSVSVCHFKINEQTYSRPRLRESTYHLGQNECVAKQHRMVVCKMALMVKKKKAEKAKPKIRWWKLKETSCREAFRQEVTRILGGKDGLPDEWDKTAEMLRKTAETVLGVTFGKRKGDRETWWWNEEVQKSIKEKKEAKKAWDKIRNENAKKIYKEKKSKAKKAVAMQRDVHMTICMLD